MKSPVLAKIALRACPLVILAGIAAGMPAAVMAAHAPAAIGAPHRTAPAPTTETSRWALALIGMSALGTIMRATRRDRGGFAMGAAR